MSSPSSDPQAPLDPTAKAGTSLVSQSPRTRALGLVVGVVSILVGIVALVWPGPTLLVLAVLFALQLIVLGALRIAAALRPEYGTGSARTFTVVIGALTVAAGLVCFFRPGASLIVLAALLAAGWILDGFAEFVLARREPVGALGTLWLVLRGVVSIAAGLVVATFPLGSLALLTVVAGVALIVLGLAQVVAAIRHRPATAYARPPATR